MPKHFLRLRDLPAAELRAMIDTARSVKTELRQAGADPARPLAGKTLAMIFEKPSTRTRVSFEVGMRQLGGEVVMLSGQEIQLGRGETIADTARVLSRYVDAIMIRTTAEERLTGLAEAATVPVINGLTDDSHPCQLMADVLTFEEHRGSIKGAKVAWSGDGNNVARSWIEAAVKFEFELHLACPEPLSPPRHLLDWAHAEGAVVTVGEDPATTVRGADAVVTDTWVSMGDKDAPSRHNLLRPYQVDDRLMSFAKPDAIFLHCLPAHRDEEVATSVIDGPQSVVFDEAENRLHAQKGVLLWCFDRQGG